MKIAAKHSHLNGFEWIEYHQNNLWKEMVRIIKDIDANDFRLKSGQEANVLQLERLDARMNANLKKLGWSEITKYQVTNSTDFVKNRVAVEVQFGKYSFIAYDLFVKHLAFYVGDTIDVGIEILPMKTMQADMSSGPGYYEGALYDLARQGRGVPAVPLVLVGIEP